MIQLDKEVWTIDELAAFLRVSRITIRRQLQSGDLHGVRVGHTWRIFAADVSDYLQKQSNHIEVKAAKGQSQNA